jgi:ankyrin repeat protein
MSAAYNGDLELVRALLRRKADLAPVDRMKKTAVLYAAANGHAQVLGTLLEQGVVDVNARYDNELTALMWAAGFGHDDAVKLLLARGAERNARDNRGKTALAIAEEEGRQVTADLLRAAGAQQ